VKDAVEWTDVEQQSVMGPLASHWLRARALAAWGDYALAQEELAQLTSGQGQDPNDLRNGLAMAAGMAILEEQPTSSGSLLHQLWQANSRAAFRGRADHLKESLRFQADLTVLRGLLALEEGDMDEAEISFQLALRLWKDEATAASGGGLDFGGRVVAQDCLQWLSQE
jgi:hypothetical protein